MKGGAALLVNLCKSTPDVLEESWSLSWFWPLESNLMLEVLLSDLIQP